MIENPFYCDERMNWIKQGEAAGWIQFRNISGITRTPECTNFPQTPWDQVVISQNTGIYFSIIFYQTCQVN